MPADSSLACFLWGAARSGTNVLTRHLAKSDSMSCYNENNAEAFDNFFLRDDAVIEAILRDSASRSVFFKAFNDTPRAAEVMARFDAQAIYAIRTPEDTIGSFAATWGQWGRDVWRDRFVEGAHGEGGPLLRLAGSNQELRSAICQTCSEAAALVDSYGATEQTVAAVYYIWQHSWCLHHRLLESNRVLVVDYDRLTDDPVGVMAKIAAHFGVESAVMSADGWRRGGGAARTSDGAPPELLARCREIYAAIVSDP